MTLRTGIVAAILIAAPGLIFSQTPIFSRVPDPSCVEIERMALQLIPEYYRLGDVTRIDSLLNSFDNRCSFIQEEFSWRMRTLLKLREGRLNPGDFREAHFFRLEEYIDGQQLIALLDSADEDPQRHYRTYFGPNADLYFTYNEFTKDLARQLLPNYETTPDCTTESMLLNALSGNLSSFSKQLVDETCRATPALMYRKDVKTFSNPGYLDAYIYTGIWVPYGNNRLLGNHPFIGFGAGGGRKFLFDCTLEFRFNDAANYYVVRDKGQDVLTNHFFGGYLGLDVGYNFASTGQSKFYILTGTGLDGFDCIEETSSNRYGKSINTLNVNGGLGWRFLTPDGNYAGLEVRNNFVSYKNPGGTPLDGNTVSIRLMYGMMKSRGKKELHRLHNMARQ